MRSYSIVIPFAVAVCLAVPLAAQRSLSTGFAGGGGLGSGGTMFFDLNAKSPLGVTELDCNLNAPGGGVPTTLTVWTIPGSHVGNSASPAGWTLAGVATGVSAPTGSPTQFPLLSPLVLPAGTHGIALEFVGAGPAYTNGTAVGNVAATNADLDILEGASMVSAFAGFSFTPRVWNGTVHYGLGTRFAASVPYGSGCQGAVGGNFRLETSRPVQGGLMLVIASNVPANSALVAYVLSPTQWNPGIQPIPGLGSCVQHVGFDFVDLVVPPTPLWLRFVQVPPSGLAGTTAYLQAVAWTPGANPAGVVSSNGVALHVEAQ